MTTELKAGLIEKRVIHRPAELRSAAADDGGHVFQGYVFEWDTKSQDLGGFRETIKKGATQKALANPKNLFAILDHEKKVQNVLGDRDSGTLKLFEDERGLAFTINAGPTQAAKDAAVVAGRNNIGMSFAFICGKQTWSLDADGSRLRTITEFKELDDLSLVVDAAYASSDVTVAKRSIEEAIESEKRAVAEQQEIERREAVAIETPDFLPRLQSLLALLRGLHWLYYSAHWQAAGPNFYGQHLLFERLYGGLPDEFDTLAEKLVARNGESSVAPVLIMAITQAWVAKWCPDSITPIAALIAGENDLQATIRSLYDDMQAAGQLTAGLDDFSRG